MFAKVVERFELDEHKLSLIAAVACYGLWGVLPIYWKGLDAVPAMEIVYHRILWSFLLMFAILGLGGRLGEALRALASRRVFLILVCSSLCLGGNWFLYIWAVNNGHVLDSSLAYYINPLLNVFFGVLVFKDRPNRLQILSFAIAMLGVFCQVFTLGRFPWLAVLLALSFAVYGVLRKLITLDSSIGMFWESAFLSVFAVTQLVLLFQSGNFHFGQGVYWQDAMLMGASVITTFPLIWFAYSAQHLSLMTLGLAQYLTPTGAFLLGIFVFKETFTLWHFVSFALIWVAIIIYSLDARRAWRLAHSLREAGSAARPNQKTGPNQKIGPDQKTGPGMWTGPDSVPGVNPARGAAE